MMALRNFCLALTSRVPRFVDTMKILVPGYHKKVIDHYENPRNVGSFDKSVGTGLVGAPACGDVMKLQIKVDENGKIIRRQVQDVRLWFSNSFQFVGD